MNNKAIPNEICAYTAGVLERASFIIHRTTRKKIRYMFHIKITVHTQDMSDFLRFWWNTTTRTEKNTKSYTCHATGSIAADIVKKTFPYIIAKRNAALIANRFGEEYLCTGKGYKKTDIVLERAQVLYEAMNKINQELPRYAMNKEKLENMVVKKRNDQLAFKEVYHDNIFDVFDGIFSESEAIMAKSIFDQFLK